MADRRFDDDKLLDRIRFAILCWAGARAGNDLVENPSLEENNLEFHLFKILKESFTKGELWKT